MNHPKIKVTWPSTLTTDAIRSIPNPNAMIELAIILTQDAALLLALAGVSRDAPIGPGLAIAAEETFADIVEQLDTIADQVETDSTVAAMAAINKAKGV